MEVNEKLDTKVENEDGYIYREVTPFIAACNDDDGDDDDDDDDYKNYDDDDCDDDGDRNAPLRRTVEAGAAGSRARGAVTGHVVDHRVHDHTDDIYIMMKCLSVTKNHHFLLGVSCNHLNPP